MPNKVSDPITHQEMAFAHLVLSGAMTDRQAAEAVGLNPDFAAHTKSNPRVRDYMLQHRAAVQQQPVQQEADLSPSRHAAERPVDGPHRLNLDRERVLDRLWEIADLSPEITRGSVTGQVKALSIIIAMQNFIPDRRAVAAEKKSPTATNPPQIYQSAWLRRQKEAAINPQPSHSPAEEEDSSACPGMPRSIPEPEPGPGSAEEAPSDPGPSQSTFANSFSPSESPEPYVPLYPPVTGTRVGFSIRKNPFARPR